MGDLDLLSTLTDGLHQQELQCDLFDGQLTGLKQEPADTLTDDASLMGMVHFQDGNTVDVGYSEGSPKPSEDLQQEKLHLLQRLQELEERSQLHKKLEQIELLQQHQQQQKLKSKEVRLHPHLLAQQLTAPLSPPQSPAVKQLTPQHSAQQQFQLTSLQQQLMQQQFLESPPPQAQSVNRAPKLLIQQMSSPVVQQTSSPAPIIITTAQPTPAAVRLPHQQPATVVQSSPSVQQVLYTKRFCGVLFG